MQFSKVQFDALTRVQFGAVHYNTVLCSSIECSLIQLVGSFYREGVTSEMQGFLHSKLYSVYCGHVQCMVCMCSVISSSIQFQPGS